MSKLRDLFRKLKRAKNETSKLKASIAGQITKEVKLRIDQQLMSGAGYEPISSWTPQWNDEFRRARRGGGVPLIDTGALRSSVRVKTRNNSGGFTITAHSDLVYARFLQEGGTTPLGTDVPARPFINLAFQSISRLTVGSICKKETDKYLKTIFRTG